MKTSNIILFTIMSSFSVLILVGALELRLFGKQSGTSSGFGMVKEVDADLRPFQILVINESINVAIEKGDSLLFQVYRPEEDSSPQVKFHQSGDTLFIDHVAFGEKGRRLHAVIKLKDVNALKGILANHSSLSMEGLDNESLSVNLNHSRLHVSSERKHINSLRISAFESDVNYYSNIQGDLEADLDHSNVYIHGTVSRFKGSIKNNSELNLQDVQQITFSKDSTSNVRIFN